MIEQRVLRAAEIRRWCAAMIVDLETHRVRIDALNDYPVPDRDTGTNLLATARAAGSAPVLADLTAGLADVLDRVATAAVLGAHGNSGVILAQYLRGVAEGSLGATTGGAATVKKALLHAAELARSAVGQPVEGTMLTVAAKVAHEAATAPDSLPALMATVTAAAAHALRDTAQLRPQSGEQATVDAGAAGLVVVLNALSTAVTGVPVPIDLGPAGRYAPGPRDNAAATSRDRRGTHRPARGMGYEVRLIVRGMSAPADGLRSRLATVGTSLVIAGPADGHTTVHLHVADGSAAAAAVGAAAAHGRLVDLSVVPLDISPLEASPPGPGVEHGVVVGPFAAGIAGLLQSERVRVVARRSSHGWGERVRAGGPGPVVVIADDDDLPLAVAAIGPTQAMYVILAGSAMQALAGVAVHDRSRPVADDVTAIRDAVAGIRTGSVHLGDGSAVAKIDGVEIGHGADVVDLAVHTVRRLAGEGGELASVVLGTRISAVMEADLVDRLGGVVSEVHVLRGAQVAPALLLGVE